MSIYDDGELWSFLRSVLSQGKDIALDHREKSSKEYHARLDLAALELVQKFRERSSGHVGAQRSE